MFILAIVSCSAPTEARWPDATLIETEAWRLKEKKPLKTATESCTASRPVTGLLTDSQDDQDAAFRGMAGRCDNVRISSSINRLQGGARWTANHLHWHPRKHRSKTNLAVLWAW